MTKALLLLTGGRSLPDMLVIKCIQPDIIINITTDRGLKTAENFQKFVLSQWNCQMTILNTIDPYDEHSIVSRCEEALALEPEAEWIIHCTTSPKVVSIYAHDIARKRNISYWILDTAGKQVISLVKEHIIDTKDLFTVSVKEYMGAYERVCEIPRGVPYQEKTKAWYPVAQILLSDHEATQVLLQGLNKAKSDKPAHPLTPTVGFQAEALLRKLSKHNFLTITGSTSEGWECTIASDEMWMFLKGDWLEFYVWQEAQNATFADDCQWGHKIIVDQKLATTLPSNELDLALTYQARLLIAECKTSKKPFGNSEDLDKLYSIANLLGGDFVKQVFITSCPRPDEKDEQFDNFRRQAEVRRISVITGDQLPQVGEILRQEMGATKPASIMSKERT